MPAALPRRLRAGGLGPGSPTLEQGGGRDQHDGRDRDVYEEGGDDRGPELAPHVPRGFVDRKLPAVDLSRDVACPISTEEGRDLSG